MENNRKTKVFIAIPSGGTIKDKTVYSLAQLLINSRDIEVDFSIQTGCYVTINRNYLVSKAQSAEASHILFIDGDMTFDQNLLKSLLSHNKDIVGTAANYRKLPLKYAIKALDENGGNGGTPAEIPNELFKCYALGGIFLVDMRVFSRIDQPWFQFEHEGIMTKTGEDVWFCEQAHKKGIDVWCDPSIRVGHIGDYIF